MKMKLIVFFIAFICISKSNAQLINGKICKDYPPSVIARLFDIVRNTKLTEEMQRDIADQILSDDKKLVTQIIEGNSVLQIDSLKRKQKNGLAKFAENLNIDFSASDPEKFANIISNGEMKFIAEMYDIDTVLFSKIRAIEYKKYKSFYQAYKGNQENVSAFALTNKIGYLTSFFDSVSYGIYPSLYAKRYLTDYINIILKLKPETPDTTIQKIKKLFYMQTNKNRYADKATILLDIMQNVYPDTTLTAHFYKPYIEKQAAYLSAAEKNNLINIQHISSYAFDSVYGLVKQKNYQQALLEYTYGGNAKLRDSLTAKTSKFYDSKIIEALLRDGSIFAPNQFAIALKYKTKLQLRPTLTDTLLIHAMYVQRLYDSLKIIDPFAKSDFKEFEAFQLNTLLTEEQYTQLLTIKNRTQAHNNAIDDWEEMQKRNITTDFNKDTTIKQLFNYYLQKLNAYYRMADDKIKQEANARIIKERQPKALRILAAAKKIDTPVNDNSKIKIQW